MLFSIINTVSKVPEQTERKALGAGLYFVKNEEQTGLYIVTPFSTNIHKIFDTLDYKTKKETDDELSKKANQTQVTDIAKSVDVLNVTKADNSRVDALVNGIIKQPAVDTYNKGANSLSAVYGLTASNNGSNGKPKQNGWDVLVRNDESKGGTDETPVSNRYNWNGETWVDMEIGNYPEDVALSGGSDKTLRQVEDASINIDLLQTKELYKSDYQVIKNRLDNNANDLNLSDRTSNSSILIEAPTGYTLLRPKNTGEQLKDNTYKTISTKVSGASIYPMLLRNLRRSRGYTFGNWGLKSQYADGLMALCSVSINDEVKPISISINKANIIEGFTLTQINTNPSITMKIRIVKVLGDYFFLEVQLIMSQEADFCNYLPYPTGGAIADVPYEWIGLFADSKIVDIVNPLNLLSYYKVPISSFNKEGVIPKLLLPDTISGLVGEPIELFKDPMINSYFTSNFFVKVTTDKKIGNKYEGKDFLKYWSYTPTAPTTFNANVKLYSNERVLLDEKNISINVIALPATLKETKEMFFGNSLTYANVIVDEYHRRLTSSDVQTIVKDTVTGKDIVKRRGFGYSNKINLIGKRRINHQGWVGEQPHEGYSGEQISFFLKAGSPFWFNGKVDFNAYLTNNNFDTPHIIYIGLGWNDIGKNDYDFRDPSFIVNNARTLLTILQTQLPNTKIVWWCENFPANWGGTGEHGYGSDPLVDIQEWKYKLSVLHEEYKKLEVEFPNLKVLNETTIQFDTENSLQETTAQVNSLSLTQERHMNDPLHSGNVGYFQLANVLAAYRIHIDAEL